MSREQRERNAWEAGFRLCRAYGDNHPHFDGEQKERQWQAYWRTVSGEPTPPATPQPETEPQGVVLAARSYFERYSEATGHRFEIVELLRWQDSFYAGARWARRNPAADVGGPQSQTMAVSPPPASGDVENLLAEKDRQIETLMQALEDIADPLLKLRADADRDGLRLDGAGCVQLLNDARWLREKARQALAGASRSTEGEQGRLGNYYGRRLTASVDDGQVVVSIGVQTLAHAVAYADWANPFDEAADDYIRTFAIADAGQFAKDVVNAMLAEREDGSTPLSDFLDKMSQAAIEDGSLGLHEDEHRIKHGETAPCETWAEGEQGAPQ